MAIGKTARPIAAAMLMGGALAVAASQASAQDTIVGHDEFMSSCAPCHGASGRGDGPVAQHLNVRPTDLTKMAERNDGQFPFLKAFQIVDGRATIAAHGERAMPVWGQRYRVEAGGDEQEINRIATEPLVRSRILELVNYLQAIQEPAPPETLLGGSGGR